MEAITFRLILSGAIILAALLLRLLFFGLARRPLRRVQEAKRRLVHRMLSAGAWLFAILGLVVIWGGSIQNLWVSVAGMVGIVAIGFFAVWSILSNVVAGVVLMLVRHLDIGDEVEVLPEKVKGKIVDITAFFVILEKKKGGKVLIPNNQFVQKVIKKS